MPTFANSSTLGFGFEVPYYFALAPNYDFTFHPALLVQPRHAVAGRLAPPAGERPVHRQACRHRPGRDATARGGLNATDGLARVASRPRASSRSRRWWRFGWDVTAESDDSFRRFYQLDPILQTDRVNTVYLQGMSDRNYFGAKLYQFGGLLLTDTPYSRSPGATRSSTTTTSSADPVLGGEFSFNAHARSF